MVILFLTEIVAADCAAQGAPLYHIPETMWFSRETILHFSAFASCSHDPEFVRVTSQGTTLTSTKAILAWAMLYEVRNESSHWKPYWDTLPPPESTDIVLTMSTAQLSELHSPALVHHIQDFARRLREHYYKGLEFLQSNYPDIVTYMHPNPDSFVWACYMIRSRAFYCVLPEGQGGIPTLSMYHNSHNTSTCMIPFADMVNADNLMVNTNAMSLHMPARKAHYGVNAYKSLKKGTEVLQSYVGDPDSILPTAHYLMYYGMSDERLAYVNGDYILLRFSTGVDTGSLTYDESVWYVGSDGRIPRAMHNIASKLELTTEEFVVRIHDAAARALSQLPTTLLADLRAHKRESLSNGPINVIPSSRVHYFYNLVTSTLLNYALCLCVRF